MPSIIFLLVPAGPGALERIAAGLVAQERLATESVEHPLRATPAATVQRPVLMQVAAARRPDPPQTETTLPARPAVPHQPAVVRAATVATSAAKRRQVHNRVAAEAEQRLAGRRR